MRCVGRAVYIQRAECIISSSWIFKTTLLTDSGGLPTVAYIAVGGNLGNVVDTISRACESLDDPPTISLIERSPLYWNRAVGGPPGQPDYLNGVVKLTTTLGARQLLQRCMAVETSYGRLRREASGPRTLDMDILLFGDMVVNESGLTIPHPRLAERLFVLVPLSDVARAVDTVPPVGQSVLGMLNDRLKYESLRNEEWRDREAVPRKVYRTEDAANSSRPDPRITK